MLYIHVSVVRLRTSIDEIYMYMYTHIHTSTYIHTNIHARRLRKKLRDTVVVPAHLDSVVRLRTSIDEIYEAKWTEGMSNAQAANVVRLYEQLASMEVCVCVCMYVSMCVCACECMYACMYGLK